MAVNLRPPLWLVAIALISALYSNVVPVLAAEGGPGITAGSAMTLHWIERQLHRHGVLFRCGGAAGQPPVKPVSVQSPENRKFVLMVGVAY